jgi:energy-converting hydrogenase Eha subunit G
MVLEANADETVLLMARMEVVEETADVDIEVTAVVVLGVAVVLLADSASFGSDCVAVLDRVVTLAEIVETTEVVCLRPMTYLSEATVLVNIMRKANA